MQNPIQKIKLSRYAGQQLAGHPELAAEINAAQPFVADEIARALAGSDRDDEAALKRRLRALRQRVLLRVMARDLAGTADLGEVCETMSERADASIRCALAWAEISLSAPAGQLVVIGMGKLGGRELNVSSDVDLVFAYPDAAGDATPIPPPPPKHPP